jgi:hypothetical protein
MPKSPHEPALLFQHGRGHSALHFSTMCVCVLNRASLHCVCIESRFSTLCVH